jgi:membrane-bound lytic murein transglycosylase B
VQLQERIVERDRNQAEFSRTLWDYLDSAVSDARISNGRAAVAEHRDTLERIERRYRVEAEVVAAIWGLESAYGAGGDRPTSSRPWRRWLMTGGGETSSRRS